MSRNESTPKTWDGNLASKDAAALEEMPDRIDRYLILGEIGAGGFGVVYEAEQTEPVKRRVALKVLKLGMDTKQVIARFEAERQALALMDHPHIAKVLDAGATETGRPFFVMEMVRGEPITRFCDRHKLTIERRLRLFQQVCNAVQHAHQKGVIHRDIKPSNVLVATHDGEPAPKVIDFGIAKATSAQLTDKTVFTQFQQLVGTPAYMSPEQADLSSIDIDTRSDVYSLGVLLYELLTGAKPFDVKTLAKSGYTEIQRLILEQTPTKPSTRIGQLEKVEHVALARQTEARKLGSLISGDLDWIVMKALEKERARRYETAVGFAADIERYLDNKPTIASPPSTSYRMRKFVKRRRAEVIAASFVGMALVLGMIGTSWGMKRAITAAEEEARARREAEQLADFQAGMLEQIDPTTAGVRLTQDVNRRFRETLAGSGVAETQLATQTETFRAEWRRINATDAATALIDETILKPAVAEIDRRFSDQPLVDAKLRQVLANRYRDLGLVDASQPLQERVLEIRRQELGDEHADTLDSMNQYAFLQLALGRVETAETAALQALETAQRALGGENEITLDAMFLAGVVYGTLGRYDEAEQHLREATDSSRRVLGTEHPRTIGSIASMGSLLQRMGRHEEAERYSREALELSRSVMGAEQHGTLVSMNNLGFLLQRMGRHEEAEVHQREAMETARRVLGEEHPETLAFIDNMSQLLGSLERFEEAEAYAREAMAKRRRVLGEGHPDALVSIHNLGLLLRKVGRADEAEPYYRESVEMGRRVLGLEHPFTLIFIANTGQLLTDLERYDETIALLSPIEGIARETFRGSNEFRVARLLLALGLARSGLGYDAERFALAESNLLEAHETFVASRGEDHETTRECAEALAALYTAWDGAEPDAGYDAKASEWQESAGVVAVTGG